MNILFNDNYISYCMTRSFEERMETRHYLCRFKIKIE